MRTEYRAALVSGMFALIACAGTASGQGLIVHAMTGQPVVGGLVGEVYSSFPRYGESGEGTYPRISNGHVVFRASTVTDETLQRPYMDGLIGGPRVALRGSDIPMRPGESLLYTYNSPARITPTGDLAIAVRLSGEGVDNNNDEAIVIRSPQGITVAMRKGDPVPGYEFAVIGYWQDTLAGNSRNWTFSSDGRAALSVVARVPALNTTGFRALLNADATGTTVIALAYGGFPPATEFDGLILRNMQEQPVVNGAGVTGFAGSFGGSATIRALATVSADGHRRLLTSGDPVPGAPGETFVPESFGTSSINDLGQMSSPARVITANGSTIRVIVRADHVDRRIVVRQGDPKPDRPGEVFNTRDLVYASTRLSGSGAVAFVDDSGLAFVGTGSNDLRLVFDPLSAAWPSWFGSPVVIDSTLSMNATNQIVAALNFPNAGRAIAAWDPVEGNTLLAYPGQQIEVAPGVFRTVLSLDITGLDGVASGGGQDGRPSAIDDAGRIVFTAHFTDQTSAVLFATIPAPAGGVMVGFGMMVCARRRR